MLFLYCSSCISGGTGAPPVCACTAGYEGNGTICKGLFDGFIAKTVMKLMLYILLILMTLPQKLTHVPHTMEDVQKTQTVRRRCPEKETANVEVATRAMALCVSVKVGFTSCIIMTDVDQ